MLTGTLFSGDKWEVHRGTQSNEKGMPLNRARCRDTVYRAVGIQRAWLRHKPSSIFLNKTIVLKIQGVFPFISRFKHHIKLTRLYVSQSVWKETCVITW
jgi:hypothetical protein